MSNNYPFYNRELSWIDFNHRVLEEAVKKENPLLERFKFLAITSSNLDEFFMVRVAGVKAQIESGYKKKDDSGLSPSQLFEQLEKKTHDFMDKQYSCLLRSLIPALNKENIFFIKPNAATSSQKKFISEYFDKIVFPVLTPLAIDNSRPFPLLSNKSLNIAVRLETKEEKETCFACVQVPSILSRFIELKSDEGKREFVLLEDIIIYKLSALFELHDIIEATPFRITRNSDLSIDEEAEDFLEEIEKSIKKRKRGRPVRLEINNKADKKTLSFLEKNLKLKKSELYFVSGPLDLTFFMKFSGISDKQNLVFKKISPVDPPADFFGSTDIFETIAQKDRLVHHPYESFNCVVNFIKTAAKDENVLAIKQTLYRVSGNSPIIDALISAAENGKQVTVLVELKARFDEENNINWAKKLEKAGCHVIYGLFGLKTHCKIALVVRREDEGIKRYLHLGTGNYNDSTAKLYTDLSLFTCNDRFGSDASSLFNVITGYSSPPEYNHFHVAPLGLRPFFKRMIENETQNAQNGLAAGITVKVNSLVDKEIVELLYKASMAGVKVKLIVRGVCSIVAGIKGISENITVISIVGQLLEHSRIFKFENAGNPKIYMGSADWMVRNLDRRIELIFPIQDEDIKQRVCEDLELMLNDTTNARLMLNDMTYHPVDKRGKKIVSSQKEFSKIALQRLNLLKGEEKNAPVIPIHTSE